MMEEVTNTNKCVCQFIVTLTMNLRILSALPLQLLFDVLTAAVYDSSNMLNHYLVLF